MGILEIVEIHHGIEGNQSDKGVIWQTVEEKQEFILEESQFILRSGDIDNKHESGCSNTPSPSVGKKMKGRARGRVLHGGVGREELGGEIGIGVGDGARERVPARAEGAVPDA